jgi:transposase
MKAAKTLKRHLPNIVAYFKHLIMNAVAEGLNCKTKTIKQMAWGFQNRNHYCTAISFHGGWLEFYIRISSVPKLSSTITIFGIPHIKE